MLLAAWLRFESPQYLVLLALLPLLVVFAVRSLAGLGPVRRVFAIVLRALVVTMAVLALAGAQTTQTLHDLAVVFLVDRSRSIPEAWQQQTFDFLRSVDAQRPVDDRVGVVAFDEVADVQQTPMPTLELRGITAARNPDHTNIAAAARLGMALLPSDMTGRIVLISDGNENVDAILEEADQFRAAGVPIDVVPIEYQHGSEVVFESLKAPPTAQLDEVINLQAVLRSQQHTTGRLRLYQNDHVVDLNGPGAGVDTPVTLEPGANRFLLPAELFAEGPHRFRVVFEPDDPQADEIASNNEGRAYTVVAGQGRVLILTAGDADATAEDSSSQLLAKALEEEELAVEVQVAREFTPTHDRLLGYSLVILDNVPASDFTEEERDNLATHVRELGGGMVMLGGPNSFGAGGWIGSPVEEVMPVRFDIQHKKQFIRGALVLVMHACEIEQGNYIGERCAVEAVKSLSSGDLIGVLAWQWQGGDRGHWVLPLQAVGDRTTAIQAIKTMQMGDMPDLDAVMRPGVQALLARNDVGPKHMIVVSDFDPSPPGDDLIKTMQDNGITCSTIAIGYGGHWINETLANHIATATGGRFYRTNDYNTLPQIFVKESREVRRSLVQDVTFTPAVVDPLSPLLAGVASGGLPDLKGLVLTTARPLADLALIRPDKDEKQQDPVLASWRVGLGKTVAFTSGLWPKWGPDWLAWSSFTKFWAQVVRWTSRQSQAAGFDVSTTVHGGVAHVQIDAYDKSTRAIGLMEIRGRVLRPDNRILNLGMSQTGPGRAEASFDAQERGDYVVDLRYRMGTGANAEEGTIQTVVSIAYSPEYADLQVNLPLLEAVRDRTSGRRLTFADGGRIFDRSQLRPAEARRSIWESLVWWMLVLFLLDVAVRRIALRPKELADKSREFLRDMAGRRGAETRAAETVGALRGTRDRLRAAQPQVAAEADVEMPEPTHRYEAPSPDRKATEELGKALGGATEMDQPVVAKPASKKPAQTEADYTSRLLRAKRRAREDLRKDEQGGDEQK